MSGPEQSRWRFAVMPLVMLSITLPGMLRDRVDWVRAWPTWRPVILDTLLVVAGAVFVAGLASGVHAWVRAKRGIHA